PHVQEADVLRGIVGERMQPIAPLRKQLEARYGVRELSGKHMLPHRAVARDPARMLRMALGQRARLRIERRAAVEPGVPGGRADAGEEGVDLGGIAAEVITKEVARIPIDEDAAEIEHDVANERRWQG